MFENIDKIELSCKIYKNNETSTICLVQNIKNAIRKNVQNWIKDGERQHLTKNVFKALFRSLVKREFAYCNDCHYYRDIKLRYIDSGKILKNKLHCNHAKLVAIKKGGRYKVPKKCNSMYPSILHSNIADVNAENFYKL